MATVNQERATVYNQGLNEQLGMAVEQYRRGQIFGAATMADRILLYAYEEACALGLRDHPFVDKMGTALREDDGELQLDCLSGISRSMRQLRGGFCQLQAEALDALVGVLKRRDY